MQSETKTKNVTETLSINVTELRKERGLTQKQLSEKAGISMTTLREIENPEICRNFSLDFIFFISDALNVSPEKLL